MAKGHAKKLTGKRLRFAQELLVDSNAAAAYRRAGYRAKSPHVASTCAAQLLATPSIAAYVAARRQKLADEIGVTAEWVRRELKRNHDRAHEGVPIVSNDGAIVGHKPDLHASNRALELLGKDRGMFAEKVEHEHKHSFTALVAKSQKKDEE